MDVSEWSFCCGCGAKLDECDGTGHLGLCPTCRGNGSVDGREQHGRPPVGALVLPGLEAWC